MMQKKNKNKKALKTPPPLLFRGYICDGKKRTFYGIGGEAIIKSGDTHTGVDYLQIPKKKVPGGD